MISSLFHLESIVMNTSPQLEPQPLFSNLQPTAPFVRSCMSTESPAVLRQRLTDDGYLYLPGALDHAPLIQARREILTLCQQAGWLDPAHPLMDGYAAINGLSEGDAEYRAVYRNVVRLASFNACAVTPELRGIFELLLGGKPFAHPRNIARIALPGGQATQPHQDFHYIRGTSETYTCWIPTAAVTAELGGLTVLPGSHRSGTLYHQRTTGAGGMGIHPTQLPSEQPWTGGDYELGDVLLFHSYTVHGARPHQDQQRIRLSFDFRYQRPADPIDPSSLCYHMEDQHPPA